MTSLCCKVLELFYGKTLVTAESCTGGGIGAALTAIPGSSAIYKGGVICYTNWVKTNVLGVSEELLDAFGPVSAPVAEAMAKGVQEYLQADAAISVTGLAGPGGDDYGNPVGTVYIGCRIGDESMVQKFFFDGDREAIRHEAVSAALQLTIAMMKIDKLNELLDRKNPKGG